MKPLVTIVAGVCIIAAALAYRLPRLSSRPMHTDEAVHAVKFDRLWRTGEYIYDTKDYHGPTLYYAALPVVWASGADGIAEACEVHFRLVPALFGAALVVLVALSGRALSTAGALLAAAMTAVSPVMVYYSRYFIQETLLVFFTYAAMLSAWGYIRTRKLTWCILAGVCVGMMHATKETSILAFFAMAAGGAATLAWNRWVVRRPLLPPGSLLKPGHLAAGVLAAVCVSVVLFSAFFTNFPRGPIDSLTAYADYFRRSGGAGMHEHPWYYYFRILSVFRFGVFGISAEVLVLALAPVGVVAALTGKGIGKASPGFARFLAFYTLILTTVYCLIPYKTPWNLLSFMHGAILLAGVGAAALVRLVPTLAGKLAASALTAGVCGLLAWQGFVMSFRYPAHRYNPYVYAHTSADVLNLARRCEQIADVSPDGRDTVIKVVTDSAFDHWPLPWYLRRFRRVGYFVGLPDTLHAPGEADTPLLIASPSLYDKLAARLRTEYRVEHFGLRPHVVLALYIRADLWQKFMRSRSRQASGTEGACGK